MVLKFKIALILILLKAPLVWGFSIARTQTYIQQAMHKKLYEDIGWLRLGHYKPKLFGSYQSKIRGSFFMAKDGAVNPQSEMLATLQNLFSEASASTTQCKYLARTQWLKNKLNIDVQDIVDCPERDLWKKKLNAREAYLIFASSDLNSAASSFGHTFIRLHNPENTGALDLIDYGVNFAAETRESDGILFALKGLFGMYPGFYSMTPYHQKLRDYINLEGRDIWEYKMNLNATQVEQMINHLLELEGTQVPYYFVDDNCSYQILELIEVVRPDLDLSSHFRDATIPLDTLKMLATQKDFLSEEKLRPSLVSNFQHAYRHLNNGQAATFSAMVTDVQHNRKIQELALDNVSTMQVLDAVLSYLAIQEYREQRSYIEQKYQLSVARAKLGGSSELEAIRPESPLGAANSTAFYLGVGKRDSHSVAQFKWRRAFHDLISRDQGVSPFSHIEALSFEFLYNFSERSLNLNRFQALKILSTNAATRLSQPISWKTSLGTEPKLNPYFEGGIGYSFDLAVGQRSRWTNLLLGRLFTLEGQAKFGLGMESIFVQKLLPKLRSLQAVKFLGVVNGKPYFESEAGFSYDLSSALEARISYQKVFDKETLLLNFIF